MTVLGYLLILKRCLGTASNAHFLHDFPIKMFLIFIILSMDKGSISYLFPSQDIERNILLRSYFDS